MPLALLSAEESEQADPSQCNEGGSEGWREHRNFSPFITPWRARQGLTSPTPSPLQGGKFSKDQGEM